MSDMKMSSETDEPLVSIVMPCYNDGIYIEESIASVFSQTYKNIELIIVNDGSTDEYTNKVLESLNHERIAILTGDRQGPSVARNLAIKKSNGKYILPLDSDDTISPDYIERAVEIIEANPKIGIVYCHADLFGEKSGSWELPDYSLQKMLLDNVIFVTALFLKKDWEITGGFSPEMYFGMEDYDFWISILELEKEAYQIPEKLFHYRIKKKSRTSNLQKNKEAIKELYRKIYLRHPHFYEKHKAEYAMTLRDALIDQMFAKEALMKLVPYYEKLVRITWLRKVVKKILRI